MLITIPADPQGSRCTASVLDIEPLLLYVRECRPDAVSLMPPPGPDDLPNGAALLTIKNRLELEGLQVIAGTWEVSDDAPVLDPAWQLQQLFEARALIAALGEAGVALLPVRWRPDEAADERHAAMVRYVDGMLEEAERSEVRLALHCGPASPAAVELVRELESPWLTGCCGLGSRHGDLACVRELGTRVGAVEVSCGALLTREPGALRTSMDELVRTGFKGPLLLRDLPGSDCACAVRQVRELLTSALPPPLVQS